VVALRGMMQESVDAKMPKSYIATSAFEERGYPIKGGQYASIQGGNRLAGTPFEAQYYDICVIGQCYHKCMPPFPDVSDYSLLLLTPIPCALCQDKSEITYLTNVYRRSRK